MARAMEDAQGWYSVWDVVVRPEYQSQRIGTAIIETLLDQLRHRGTGGGRVFLFTFSHKFYQRLGFSTETCSMVRL
jgi:GNAT superfamily N-acetyltransferase